MPAMLVFKKNTIKKIKNEMRFRGKKIKKE